jgi:energy-coupling factor transporter ATP-binding protein EcfA2
MIHVGELILVAGPSCVGKSTLIKKLQEGTETLLSEKVELGDPASWTYSEGARLHKIHEPHVDRMIFHYDILRPWKLNIDQGYEGDESLRILDTSEAITFVTLWATPQALIQRLRSREADLIRKTLSFRNIRSKWQKFRDLHKLWKRQKLYTNTLELFSFYDKWFEFCNTYILKAHWIINTTGSVPQVISFKELERYTNRLRCSNVLPR